MIKKSIDKFTGKAYTYDKYRPSYSSELIDYLLTFTSSIDDKIADIGSGTGKFTELLLQRGYSVKAVEPNDDMRSTALSNLSKYDKLYTQLGASAEETGIESESINLITAAQSFHWFDVQQFKAECKRILVPDGYVALIWNSRDTSSDIVNQNGQICKRLCSSFEGFSGGFEQTPASYIAFFRNGKYEHTTYRNDITFTLDEFIGRNLSASYAPNENQENYNRFIKQITDLFNQYQVNGTIAFPNVINCYCGKV